MKTAIGYIRVSTEKQVNEGMSLEAQQERITQWCHDNGYELAQVFVDAGISGKNMSKRPGVQQAMAAMKKGMALVSYSMSRLARSTVDAIKISEEIAKKKGDLVLIADNIDTTTATGRAMFKIMAVMAELERELISERTVSGLQYMKRHNLNYTNKTPYGFEAVDGKLIQVAQEAEVVAEIQASRTAGNTLQSIADNLNGRGIPTKTGKSWAPATIHLLLKRSSLVAAH